MRALLFRGLQKELFCPAYWRVGSLVISYDEGTYIQDGLNRYYVDSETVGQYTGIVDRKGNRIFEGDIISKGNAVTFCNGMFCINGDRPLTSDCEVIGNIYDNPNLMNDKLVHYQLFHPRTNSILDDIWTDNFVKAMEAYIAEATVRTGVVLRQLAEDKVILVDDSYIQGIETNEEW